MDRRFAQINDKPDISRNTLFVSTEVRRDHCREA
jgi:hypothetical protein